MLLLLLHHLLAAPPTKWPKTAKALKEPAVLKVAPAILAAGPVKDKGKVRVRASTPEYVPGSDGEDSESGPKPKPEPKPKSMAHQVHSLTPSGSKDEDLTTSLHTCTKVAAIMAGIAVPPGCCQDHFKKRYVQYTAEKTLGMHSLLHVHTLWLITLVKLQRLYPLTGCLHSTNTSIP